jgi:hypothetical protein
MIPKMLKLSFKNTSTNISIPNHISNDKTMYDTNKIITNNKYLVYFHGKNIPPK